MLTYCLKKDTVADCLTKKYSTHRYEQVRFNSHVYMPVTLISQVAPLVRSWILRYWSEGERVSLEEWLPFIIGFAGLWDS